MAFLRRIGLALSVGFILMFFSERVFWSFARGEVLQPENGDTLGVYVATWLIYALFAYMTLVITEYFRVRSIWAIFLAGTAFGWIGEGIYAMTFFGGGGIPLPFSIIWTGVAWHALISVLIGLYYLRVFLVEKSYLHTVYLSSAIGFFWGFWAVAWILETPPLLVDPIEFFAHGVGFTLFFILAQRMIAVMRPASFVSTRTERFGLLGIALLFMGTVTFSFFSVLVGILAVCFALLFAVLWYNKKREAEGSMLAYFEQQVSFTKLSALFAMPIVATMVYSILNVVGFAQRTNFWILIASSVIGTGFLVFSIFKVLSRKA